MGIIPEHSLSLGYGQWLDAQGKAYGHGKGKPVGLSSVVHGILARLTGHWHGNGRACAPGGSVDHDAPLILAAASCLMIPDPDQRAYCRILESGNPAHCVEIADYNLRQRCRVELGDDPAQCNCHQRSATAGAVSDEAPTLMSLASRNIAHN